MINKTASLFISILIFSACNNNTDTPAVTQDKEPAKVTETTTSCYQAIHEKDSVLLLIKVKENVVTGNLTYNLFEKDKNTGSIAGEMKGDTIFATYSFMSEGVKSEREVAFVKSGDSLVEGFGAVEDKNGKFVFKNKAALVYDTANILTKIDCRY